jgi:hypothetical protein
MRSPAPLDKHRRGRPDSTRRDASTRATRGAGHWSVSLALHQAPSRSTRPRATTSWFAAGAASSQALAWALGVAGLAAYNWWIVVPLRPGLLHSPNEVFSNLEVTGRPFAAALQIADLLSGLLMLAAFVLVGGRSVRGGRRDWLALVTFAVTVALGGFFPETCADSINAACRRREETFQLPASQYLHIAASLVEFGAITLALVIAVARTRGQRTRVAVSYRILAWAAAVGYPLLGLSYLVSRYSAVIEAAFFTGFTVLVVTELSERTSRRSAA